MSTEEYAILAGGALIALLIGFLMGKKSEKSIRNKNIGQKLLPNEMERWRLDGKYSELLMSKSPQTIAEKELRELEELHNKNEQKRDEINGQGNVFIKEIDTLRKEYKQLASIAQKSLHMETSMSIWSARVAEVRESTQNLNNLIISIGYTRKFLQFAVNGRRKPEIVGLMDADTLGRELKKAQKKNWETVQKLTDSMVNEYQNEAEKLFALEG